MAGRSRLTPFFADPAERARFLDAVRTTGSVYGAARATGAAPTTIARHRQRDPAFDMACVAALGDLPTRMLAAALIDRLTHGVARTRRYASGRVDEWREYDNRTALALLARLDPARFGDATDLAPPPPPPMTRAEFMAAIDAGRRTPVDPALIGAAPQ